MNAMPLWRRLSYCIVMAIALLPVSELSDLHADNIRIGVVNTEKILRESAPALQAQQKIDQEFIPRDIEIKDMANQAKTLQEKLEQKGATMNDTDRRELERELANLSRNYQRAQRQMRDERAKLRGSAELRGPHVTCSAEAQHLFHRRVRADHAFAETQLGSDGRQPTVREGRQQRIVRAAP